MKNTRRKPFIHKLALVESRTIGVGTRIWGFTHVLKGAKIGKSCNIGEHCYIESGVVIGNNVTVKNGVALWDGVTVEDGAFIGPYAVFTNDLWPRSAPGYKTNPNEFLPTRVCRGATIGANATIVCGATIGEWAFVAAGAVVTRDVEPHAVVAGVPAKRVGTVCKCGITLTPPLSRKRERVSEGRVRDSGVFRCECGAVLRLPARRAGGRRPSSVGLFGSRRL